MDRFPNPLFSFSGQKNCNTSSGNRQNNSDQGFSTSSGNQRNSGAEMDADGFGQDGGWNASSLGVNYNFYFGNPGGYQVNFSSPGNPVIFGDHQNNTPNHHNNNNSSNSIHHSTGTHQNMTRASAFPMQATIHCSEAQTIPPITFRLHPPAQGGAIPLTIGGNEASGAAAGHEIPFSRVTMRTRRQLQIPSTVGDNGFRVDEHRHSRASHQSMGQESTGTGNASNHSQSRGVTPYVDDDELFIGSQGSHNSHVSQNTTAVNRNPMQCLHCHQYGNTSGHEHHPHM